MTDKTKMLTIFEKKKINQKHFILTISSDIDPPIRQERSKNMKKSFVAFDAAFAYY